MPAPSTRWIAICALVSVTLIPVRPAASQDDSKSDASAMPLVGPQTEERFPPLVVPDGFKATLFACDPLIEYPSVISLGPRAGTLFVAHDYVTGLGIEIVRRDEVRLIEDSDKDGYADRSTVFAGGFNSIQGLAFYDGSVFVMHAPLLTSLRDTDGDGTADERRDLFKGLGLPPEENSNRLHCANGVTAGHDGWLYLALGDRGCDVKRPEGDRLLFRQGGILRCRTDGSDLHVFSTGLRNIYDVALDDELNVFVRDNENDGGDYMIRVCHCFFGSDHGYPYHYYERPDELMPALADLGRGSSAGGTSYLETAFPKEFQESLFFCEWGRAVVRYPKSRSGSTFAPMSEVDVAAGAADDPYGFKPTDLVVDYDGSMLISDWADGQRPKRGRGRIYRLTYASDARVAAGKKLRAPGDRSLEDLLKQLDSLSYHQRVAAQLELERHGASAVGSVKTAMQAQRLSPHGRLHGVWVIARSDSKTALDSLFAIAESDADPRVRAQAIRAIGDATDPVLIDGRIKAGRGDHKVAERIAELVRQNADARVVLDSLIVLRRLRWCLAAEWIELHLTADDSAVNHAATQTLRHARDWIGAVKLLDGSPRLRRLALHSMAEQRVEYLADRLIERLVAADDPQHRREYADALSRIVRELPPWKYWGFRPAPRPAATVDWEKTPAIVQALNARLADRDFDIRSFVLQCMLREGAVPELPLLADWLRQETDDARVAGILVALKAQDATDVQPLLMETVLRRTVPETGRTGALAALIAQTPADVEPQLMELADGIEDGPVLAALIREYGRRPKLDVNDLLLSKLDSMQAVVRAEAIRALGIRGESQAQRRVAKMLLDENRDVRLAAAESAGLLNAKDAAESLLMLATGDDRAVVEASLNSLRRLRDGRAAAAATSALDQNDTQLAAIAYLRDFGQPTAMERVVDTAKTNLSFEVQREVARTLTVWDQKFPDARPQIRTALASVHGQSGQPFAWRTSEPIVGDLWETLKKQLSVEQGASDEDASHITTVIADGGGAEVQWAASKKPGVRVAWSLVSVPDETPVVMLASATGRLSVWLNYDQVHKRKGSAAFRADSDRFTTTLRRGMNVVVVAVQSDDAAPRFHLRFRRRSSKAEHERMTQLALQSRGNSNRGREVFANVQKAACVNCHWLVDKGGRIGPDLSGIGRRFSRIHLIESILEPSRTVAPSYSTVVVVLNNGRTVAGVRVSENNDLLVVGDNQGKLHEILKSDIDEVVSKAESTMPEGLEKKLTDREFVDLLSFLESQKTGK